MGLYDQGTFRPDVKPLIKEDAQALLFQETTQRSAALSMLRSIPILSNETSFAVADQLPVAYWLTTTEDPPSAEADHPNSDITLIPTTKAAWRKVMMHTADLATIVPIPNRVIDDARDSTNGGINLTEQLKPLLAEAAAMLIDQAIFFGVNKPDIWPDSIVEGAIAVDRAGDLDAPEGNNVIYAQTTPEEGGLAADVIRLMTVLASQGYSPNAIYGRRTFKYRMMNARDTTGQPLLDIRSDSILGERIMFGGDGVWPANAASTAQLIAMDTSKILIGVRQGIEFDVSESAVIQDNTGAIQFNLYQQDMTAVRMTMRVGYAVANPTSRAVADSTKRWPAAVLTSAPVAP